jgi:hypothetical protein
MTADLETLVVAAYYVELRPDFREVPGLIQKI